MTQVAASNRVRMTVIRESTLGVTPASPRMRTARFTGESLQFVPTYANSNEIRSDRMMPDPILNNQTSQGGVNAELSYPVDNTALSEFYRSAFFNAWTNAPYRDNDGVAASQITGVTTGSNTIAIAGGSAIAVGHLARTTGFGQAANNGVNRVTTGGTTSIVCSGAAFATEASPASTARLKVVGFQGAASDITATASGLGSTILDFTTLGLAPGMALKIGATAAGSRFATAACNDWVRISGPITAQAIPLDNLPAGWGVDAGTGKTISVWFGDEIKNGVTTSSVTIERGFLDQVTPTYITQRGLIVDSFSHNVTTDQIITGAFNFKGMTGAQGTASIASTTDAATTSPIMSSNVSVGRIAEAGSTVSAPNWIKALQFTVNNNLRLLDAAGNVGAVDIGVGECAVSGQVDAYFGSNALLAKLFLGTITNLSARVAANGQACVYQFPRVTLTGGSPNAAGKNQDVVVQFKFDSSYDPLTSAHIILDRLEYFEV